MHRMGKSTSRRRATQVSLQVLGVALATALAMLAFEAAKMLIRPQISLWTSHIFTIVFATLVAAVLSFMLLGGRKSAEARVRLQAAALEAAANSIVITDRQGTILWTNRAFSELTGYGPDEARGKNPRMLSSGEHDEVFYRTLWETIASGKIWHGEIINRRKDGSLYTEEMTITPVRTDCGEVTHFVAIKQDVTERKRAEAAVQRAEEKYRAIFEDAVIGIYQSSQEGRLLSVNRALAQMLGYESPAQLITDITDIASQVHGDRNRREEFKRLLSAHGVVHDFEYQANRKDGTKVWLLENARAVRDERGEIRFYEGTVHDITEHKLLEEQFRQAQKMEAVGRLAGGVAHDFNNALGVITGYSELLQLSLPVADPLRKHAEEIEKAGRRAASLTHQLLAFSRKQAIQPVVLDLNSVVADIDKMLRRLIGEDINLAIVRDSRLKSVKADRGQVEQVLMNLAVNARDAMPQGGKLIIETANTQLDESYVRQHPYAKAWPLCHAERQRYRLRDGQRDAGPYLRAVLHYQGSWQGYWTGPIDGVRRGKAGRRLRIRV